MTDNTNAPTHWQLVRNDLSRIKSDTSMLIYNLATCVCAPVRTTLYFVRQQWEDIIGMVCLLAWLSMYISMMMQVHEQKIIVRDLQAMVGNISVELNKYKHLVADAEKKQQNIDNIYRQINNLDENLALIIIGLHHVYEQMGDKLMTGDAQVDSANREFINIALMSNIYAHRD
jgi:hypothetical protein